MAKSTTRRPRLPTASATANGRLPPPQMIASGLSAAVGAAAGSLMLPREPTHDEWPWSAVVMPARMKAITLRDERVAAAMCRDQIESLAKRPGAEEHRLIGPPQPMDISLA